MDNKTTVKKHIRQSKTGKKGLVRRHNRKTKLKDISKTIKVTIPLTLDLTFEQTYDPNRPGDRPILNLSGNIEGVKLHEAYNSIDDWFDANLEPKFKQGLERALLKRVKKKEYRNAIEEFFSG